MIIPIYRTIITYAGGILYFFIGSFFAIIQTLISKRQRYSYWKYSRVWSRLLLWLGGVRLEVMGIENALVDGKKIFISNHQGVFDIPILIATLPMPFRFIVKMELFKVPLLGWYMSRRGDIAIDRAKGRKALETLHEVAGYIEKEEPILIFPEGTRSKDGQVAEFKRGSLVLATRTNAKIIPIAISGSIDIQKKKSKFINPARVKVVIGEPIHAGKNDDILVEIRAKIISLMNK